MAYVRDLFGGGAETTGQELYWAILCALLHPDYTKLVLGEIDTVVGRLQLVFDVCNHIVIRFLFPKLSWPGGGLQVKLTP